MTIYEELMDILWEHRKKIADIFADAIKKKQLHKLNSMTHDEFSKLTDEQSAEAIKSLLDREITAARKESEIATMRKCLNNLSDSGDCLSCYGNYCKFRDRIAELEGSGTLPAHTSTSKETDKGDV